MDRNPPAYLESRGLQNRPSVQGGPLGILVEHANAPQATHVKQPQQTRPVLSKEDRKLNTNFEQNFRAKTWSGNIHELPDRLVEANRRALIIAIRYYRQPPPKLDGTYADAQKVANLLVDRFGYENSDICVLSDLNRAPSSQNGSDLYPSKENIEKGLRWLSSGTRAGDFRFLYYAGHGCRRIEASPGAHCEGIIPADVHYSSYQQCSDCMCELKDNPNADTLDPKWVVWDYTLNKILAESLADAANLTVVLDCCHSGGTLSRTFNGAVDALSAPAYGFARGSSMSHPSGCPSSSSNFLPVMSGNLLHLPNHIDLGNGSDPAVAVVDETTPQTIEQAGGQSSEEPVARSSEAEMPDFEPLGFDLGPGITADTSGTLSDSSQVNCYPHRPFISNIQAFQPGCRVLCWAACRRYQEAYEGERGGFFTETFVDHLNETPDSTYRALNRRINERFSNPIGTGEGGRPIIQTPQLYASANMGTGEGAGNGFEHRIEL